MVCFLLETPSNAESIYALLEGNSARDVEENVDQDHDVDNVLAIVFSPQKL